MNEHKDESIMISRQALSRMPYYLDYLKKLRLSGAKTVSAPSIAGDLNLGDIQVRKDLAAVSKTGGKPKNRLFSRRTDTRYRGFSGL